MQYSLDIPNLRIRVHKYAASQVIDNAPASLIRYVIGGFMKAKVAYAAVPSL